MKVIYVFFVFTFIKIQVFAQQPGDPGYRPLKAKLLSLQHKANSNTLKTQKRALDAFQLNQLDESVNIYVRYEIDMNVARDPKTDNKMPKKVMDLDFIYSYKYLIPYSSNTELNELLPVIALRKGQRLESVKASNSFISKGKVKRVKIKSKDIIIDTTSQQLTLAINNAILENNAFLEIEIELKTSYFNSLLPSFSTKGDFNRSLTVSVPAIFKYQLPKDSLTFKLQSEEKNPFIFLQLNRKSLVWDEVAKPYWTDCTTFNYKVMEMNPLNTNIAFELETIDLPPGLDIGVPVREIYLHDK
jgi:hypothetical protein